MANKITAVFDLDGKGFTSGIKSLRTQVAEADGAIGKMKTGASGLGNILSANLAAGAIAAGGALVALGVKGVAAFQETALEAGKFSDATGLAVEDASRWLEVAGDMGVEASTIEGSFVKLNKAIGSGDATLKKYGIGLITAADGTADVNQTMLTAIQRIGAIKDPTERAAAAQAAFGKSYKEAAEIVLGSADDLKKKLAEVSGAKVIDEEELERARKFRDAIENLKDITQDLTTQVGEGLVPALTDVAETAADIRDVFGSIPKAPWIVEQWWDKASPLAWQRNTANAIKGVGGAIKGVFGGGGEAPKAFEATTTAADQYVESLEQMHQAAIADASAEQEHASMLNKVRTQAEAYVDLLQSKGLSVLADIAEATNRARKANKLLADSQRDLREATLDSLDTMFDYEKSVMDVEDSVSALNQTVEESPDDWRAVREAQIDTAESALQAAQAFAASKGAVEGSTASALLQRQELERLAAKFPELSSLIQGYIDKLNSIPATKTTQLVVTSKGKTTTAQVTNKFGRLIDAASVPQTAAGGIVPARTGGTLVNVGEAGHAEAIVPLSGPNAPGGLGGSTYNITLNVQQALTPNEVIDLAKKYERLNGAGWRGA